ncbi:2-hydroxyacid dehydrogenase [Actinomadura vinacea]|uniref:2-hydroxyacid dehydrogenase n=1 Tax=Actinomadura vinacea TaxID=115336 RepID=A0ABP5W9A8_9ACTN
MPFRDLLDARLPEGAVLSMHPRFDEAAVIPDLAGAEVFVGPAFTPEMGRAARRLRLVHVAGAGVDAVDRAALPPGTILANTFHHGRSIAEYAAMALLALNRELLVQDRELRAGRWHSSVYDPALSAPPVLAGQTVGLIGFGHIGGLAWERLRGFGMRGVAVGSRARPDDRERAGRNGLEWLGGPDRLHELLAGSDAVIVSVPLGPATEGLIGAAELAAMKPSALLVNVGRGPLVDERALYEALRDRRIRGAAIDVWYRYPAAGERTAEPSRFPFGELDNVLMTPHSSGVTAETYTGRIGDIAANITRLAEGGPLERVVARA